MNENQLLRQILAAVQSLPNYSEILESLSVLGEKILFACCFFGVLWFVVKMIRGRYNLL